MTRKGYWVVAYRSVSDASKLAEYVKLAGAALEDLGARVLVAGSPRKTHEAGVEEMTVVVEFDSLDKAIAAYESEEYKPALRVFGRAAERDFRIVEGL